MNFEQARSNMVLNQLRANRISNSSLIEKIELFPRENLYPKSYKHLAYSDKIIFLDDGRFILPPLTSFHLVQALGEIKNENILEIGSGFGTSTSIISKFSTNIDCIETSQQMTQVFKDSLTEGLFDASLLDLTIEEFFSNKTPNIQKYQKIIINGSLDEEPLNLIKNVSDNSEIVCIIDNKDFKHKIVKYLKVGGKSNKFVIDEASSSYIYKYVQSEPFVF
tara:strand:+ start:333 stop:995 length:663 start_codon:yes stop_codon:yes gene_type:complete